MAEPTIEDVRALVQGTPPRGDKEALAAFGLLREMFPPACAVPCPMCGYPCDPREAGTHIRTGYRSPCPRPYLPGSWNYKEEQRSMREREAEG